MKRILPQHKRKTLRISVRYITKRLKNFCSINALLHPEKNKCVFLPERHTTLLFKLARSHSRLLEPAAPCHNYTAVFSERHAVALLNFSSGISHSVRLFAPTSRTPHSPHGFQSEDRSVRLHSVRHGLYQALPEPTSARLRASSAHLNFTSLVAD